MVLQPMGQAEILLSLINKAMKELELIKQEVRATLPAIEKRSGVPIVDPRTGVPFRAKKAPCRQYRPETGGTKNKDGKL
jgi:hypothetical protein